MSGQGHEMCALLILGEINNSSLINATNVALQMWVHLQVNQTEIYFLI